MFEKKDGIYQYQTSLTVSYMEIYKDEVYDLLVTRENVCIPFVLYLCLGPRLGVIESDNAIGT